MKDFLNDTKDPVERLWASEVLSKFPNYGVFWNKYIGFRDESNVLRPYKLKYNSNMAKQRKREIRDFFDRLNMHHYTLFCNLAGAHHQYEIILNEENIENPNQKYFIHWEAFDNVYIKLGNSLFQVDDLWKIVLTLNGNWTTLPRRHLGGLTRYHYSLRELLKQNRNTKLWKSYIRTNNIIKDVRNEIVHFARKAGSYLPGFGFLLPFKKNVSNRVYPPRINKTWLHQVRYKKFLETSVKAKEDIDLVESTIDAFYDVMMKEIDLFLTNNNVKVIYP